MLPLLSTSLLFLLISSIGTINAQSTLCTRATDTTDQLAAAGYHWAYLATLGDPLYYRDYQAYIGLQSDNNKQKLSILTTVAMTSAPRSAWMHMEIGKLVDTGNGHETSGAFRFHYRLTNTTSVQADYVLRSDVACQIYQADAGFSADDVGEIGIYQLVKGL